MAVVIVIALSLLSSSRPAQGRVRTPPYAANLKLSDFKMSAAENFVGATVSYIDGTVTNTGDQTVTHVSGSRGLQRLIWTGRPSRNIPLHVLQTTGPYPEAVDFKSLHSRPGQSQTFRLTFESISAQWNHQYPDIKVTDDAVKNQN